MFSLNKLLKKPFFHQRFWFNLTATVMMVIGSFFHIIYVSEKMLKNKQDYKVLFITYIDTFEWESLNNTRKCCSS